jgi:hypothetical protein
VLDAAREQIAHRRAALEDRAHAVRDRVGVAVGAPGRADLLKLVEEQQQPALVGGGNALGQLERQVERSVGVLRGEPRRERDLDPLPQLTDQPHHRPRLGRRQRGAAGAAGAAQQPVRGRAVGDHGRRERLGQLGRVRHAEQVEAGHVGAPSPRARQGRLADARLAGAARTRDDEVRAGLEPGGDLAHVVPAPDHLTGGDGRVRWEEVAARLSHRCKAYTKFV